MIAAGAPADCEPQVRQSAKVQFGDYQANGMMAVAKKLGMAPRQLAEQVLTHLDLNGIASKVEIAGPGFINIFLYSFITQYCRSLSRCKICHFFITVVRVQELLDVIIFNFS